MNYPLVVSHLNRRAVHHIPVAEAAGGGEGGAATFDGCGVVFGRRCLAECGGNGCEYQRSHMKFDLDHGHKNNDGRLVCYRARTGVPSPAIRLPLEKHAQDGRGFRLAAQSLATFVLCVAAIIRALRASGLPQGNVRTLNFVA